MCVNIDPGVETIHGETWCKEKCNVINNRSVHKNETQNGKPNCRTAGENPIADRRKKKIETARHCGPGKATTSAKQPTGRMRCDDRSMQDRGEGWSKVVPNVFRNWDKAECRVYPFN